MGLIGWIFNLIRHNTARKCAKFIYCICGAISLVVMEEYGGIDDVKYIGALFYGYTLSRVWGSEKPVKEVAWFWFFV